MSSEIAINEFILGERYRPYIIAEIGVNHGGSMELAKQLIEAARDGGAHAAKFQTYTADKIAVRDSPAYWDLSAEPTATQHALFKKYDSFGQAEFEELAGHCAELGIDFLSTAFDLEAVDFLAPLMPAFKIASADITNVPLVRRCAAHGKPLIISTGASTVEEIERAVRESTGGGASSVALLHCVLNYPTPPENAQLGFIPRLREAFPEHAIGYSDHVVPDECMTTLSMAVHLGCDILEKHFTHDKTLPGNDHYHAMDVRDLKRFTDMLARFSTLYGNGGKSLALERDAIVHARRSVVAARAIKAGERFTAENLVAKRPGYGISPLHWDELLEASAAQDIEADTIIQWQQVKLHTRSGSPK